MQPEVTCARCHKAMKRGEYQLGFLLPDGKLFTNYGRQYNKAKVAVHRSKARCQAQEA